MIESLVWTTSEALMIISGDFNHVILDSTLVAFHQLVNCPATKKTQYLLGFPRSVLWSSGNHYKESSTLACKLGACPRSGRHPASSLSLRGAGPVSGGTDIASDEDSGVALPQNAGKGCWRSPAVCLQGRGWRGGCHHPHPTSSPLAPWQRKWQSQDPLLGFFKCL